MVPDTVKETEVFIPKAVSWRFRATVDYSISLTISSRRQRPGRFEMEASGGALVGPTLLVPFLVGGPQGYQEFPKGLALQFHKITHKFSDTALRRTRIRGVTLKGKLVSA